MEQIMETILNISFHTSSMAYWLSILNSTNWDKVKKELIIGYRYRNRRKFSSLQKGDFIVFYVKTNQIVGICKIIEMNIDKRIKFKGGEFPNQIKLEKIIIPKYPAKIVDKYVKYEIINKLSIFKKVRTFKNPSRWGLVLFGKTLIRITEEDFIILKNLLKES